MMESHCPLRVVLFFLLCSDYLVEIAWENLVFKMKPRFYRCHLQITRERPASVTNIPLMFQFRHQSFPQEAASLKDPGTLCPTVGIQHSVRNPNGGSEIRRKDVQ